MRAAKPLREPALNKAVQERVKHYITANHLAPGDPLPPEMQLAADLGISRGSVREAIKALESLGIIEVRHGTGVFVRGFNFDSMLDLLTFGLSFDPTKISEILQIRKWLETAAIGDVCERITAADIHTIEQVLAQWDQRIAADEPTADEDRAFHRSLYQVIGNESLIALIDIFWVVYHSVNVTKITQDVHPTTTIQDHRDILAAIKKRNASLARRQIQDHFRGFEERIKGADKLSLTTEPRKIKRNGSKKS
jgi:DNA-binding FadR family transcriptional regulator